MDLFSYSDSKELFKSLASKLGDALLSSSESIFFYSGGSAFDFYPYLLEHVYFSPQLNCTFIPVDERFGKDSNCLKFSSEDCFSGFKSLGVKFVDTYNLGDSFDEFVVAYKELIEGLISRALDKNIPMYALLGMGNDGHIAGMLPRPKNIFDSDFVVTQSYSVGYDATGLSEFTQRATLTLPGLQKMSQVFVSIPDSSKASVFEQSKISLESYHEVPARMLSKLENVSVYINQKA